jgi:5-methylcytosine-specific restriction enzyme A
LHLDAEPLCRMCKAEGRTVAATVADHIVAHKGDATLFWDPSNLQSLCDPHHSGAKQSEERTGYSSAIGIDGWPIDPRHPANARR